MAGDLRWVETAVVFGALPLALAATSSCSFWSLVVTVLLMLVLLPFVELWR